jgi:hypothetical protein
LFLLIAGLSPDDCSNIEYYHGTDSKHESLFTDNRQQVKENKKIR